MINSDKKIKGENNMVQEQYTTKRRKGQHLKLIERGKIEAFLINRNVKSENSGGAGNKCEDPPQGN